MNVRLRRRGELDWSPASMDGNVLNIGQKRRPVRRALLLAVVLVAAVGGMALVGAGPFQDDPDPDRPPEIQSFEITDRGCQDEVRDFASSNSAGDGDGVDAGTIDTASPETELSAEIRRTSPESAEIITYRVDLRTHDPVDANESCPGRIAYRIEYDAPSGAGATGHRVALGVDGRIKSCGGSTSGPELGCHRLMSETTTRYTNESDAGT